MASFLSVIIAIAIAAPASAALEYAFAGATGFNAMLADPAAAADPRSPTNRANAQLISAALPPVRFASLNASGAIFPPGTNASAFVDAMIAGYQYDFHEHKADGFAVFVSMDLMIFPTRLLELYKDQVCDPMLPPPVKGMVCRISLDRNLTRDIYRGVFDELESLYPGYDGLAFRTGEIYTRTGDGLYQGNSPVPWMRWPPNPATNTTVQQAAYVRMLSFLREELCVKRGKHVHFRTWDTYPDRFHANRSYYLAVVDQIAPHPKLVFSIKHTAVDFWRRVMFNPTLGAGKHKQAVENDVKRNYDGNGAFPHYTGAGIVSGNFSEYTTPALQRGLRNLVGPLADQGAAPLVGYTGGFDNFGRGMAGPATYGSGLWPDLNNWVPLEFLYNNGTVPETELFARYCATRLGLSAPAAAMLRDLALLATRALLLGRYCEPFDATLGLAYMPTGDWFEMDRLAGLDNLGNPLWNHDGWPNGPSVMGYLHAQGLIAAALAEKEESVVLWDAVGAQYEAMVAAGVFPATAAGRRLRRRLGAQVRYARLLFGLTAGGWAAMAYGYAGDQGGGGSYNVSGLCDGVARYDQGWAAFTAFVESNKWSPAPFKPYWLGQDVRSGGNLNVAAPGIGASVDKYRHLCLPAARTPTAAIARDTTPDADAGAPCDILGAAGNPCVAAHSTVRALYRAHAGPLYAVTRASDKTSRDIGCSTVGGFANSAAQDAFCEGTECVVSRLYDQSPQQNHLAPAPGGPWYSPFPDKPVNATRFPLTVGGHNEVYGAYFEGKMGYRNDTTSSIPTGDEPETIIMVVSGKHYNDKCCFDYGNAETNNHDDGVGTMECVYFGSSHNGMSYHPSSPPPWVMADLENGLWASNETKPNASAINATFVTALLKGKASGFALKFGDAQASSSGLTTLYEGPRPPKYTPMKKQGAIILGIGGDNSNGAVGAFFEGVIAVGYTSDTTDDAVQASIVAAGYGSWNP